MKWILFIILGIATYFMFMRGIYETQWSIAEKWGTAAGITGIVAMFSAMWADLSE